MQNTPSKALPLCISTLLVGGVFVLQNAEYYSSKLQDLGHPASTWTAEALINAAEYTGLTEFNISQRSWLDKWIALGTGKDISEEEVEEIETEPAPPVAEEQPQQPAPAPAPAPSPVLNVVDDESDPLPSENVASATEEPPAPLLEEEPNPLETATALPWPTPEPEPPPAPIVEDVIEPTPPPSPLVDDVIVPAPAPTTESTGTQESGETTQDAIADTGTQSEEPVQPTETTLPTQAPPVRCKIMMLGDSMMEDLGPRTHRFLRERKGLKFILSAKYSTGLCRPDFFDWPAHMRDAVAEHKPNIVVVFIGANDGQPIKHNGTFTPTGGQAWRDAYGVKMQEIVDIAKSNGAKVIWVGLPGMGNRYKNLLAETSRTQIDYCQKKGICHIDTRPTLADENGEFIAFKKGKDGKIIRTRRPDKTHLTPEGNHMLIEQLMPLLEKHLIDFSAEHPELCLSEEEAQKMGPATLAVTVKYVPSTRKRRRR